MGSVLSMSRSERFWFNWVLQDVESYYMDNFLCNLKHWIYVLELSYGVWIINVESFLMS